MTTKIAQFEQERKRLSARLAELERERADLADALAAAQAQAARGGDAGAAAEFERRRAELALQAERLSAALAAVDADLQAAREAKAQAERERLEKRLAQIYRDAGELADRLQSDPTDRAAWARLCDLHAEHVALRRQLYGVDILAQPNPCPAGWNWQHPRAGWRAWWAAVDQLAFGAERSAEETAVLQAAGWRVRPLPRSLRAALGL